MLIVYGATLEKASDTNRQFGDGRFGNIAVFVTFSARSIKIKKLLCHRDCFY